ncbi:hypothetical protein DNTS_014944, partial [Danionella cerebrum]
KRPADDVDVVVLETDYRSYAVLVFKKGTNITVKLYGRSGDVPDNIVDKFEGHAKTFNLGLDVIFPYPAYGFCEAAERVMEKRIKQSLPPVRSPPLIQTERTNTSANMGFVLKMLCVLLCAVFASAEVMPMTDFNLQQMEGKWYLFGFATNAKWFVEHKDDMKMGTAMMVATEEGDLDMSYTNLKSDGSCWRMTHLAKKTETPGRFVFFSQRWGNENDMRVVDAKFDEYIIAHTIKTKGDVSEVLNKLYSKNFSLTL